LLFFHYKKFLHLLSSSNLTPFKLPFHHLQGAFSTFDMPMKYLLLLLFLFLTGNAFAQFITPDSTKATDTTQKKVYRFVERMPQFPGGEPEMMKYLSSHIWYSVEARKKGIEGRVVIQFLIENNGSLSNIKVIKSLDRSLDDIAVQAISNMPKWTPGIHNGNPVRVSFNVPIDFTLK